VVPARSSRHGFLLARGNHAAVEKEIHLSRLFSFPRPPHIAMVRAKVEHPFRVIKRQFGHVKMRYRGLAKNRAQLFTLFALGNLFLVRRRLMT